MTGMPALCLGQKLLNAPLRPTKDKSDGEEWHLNLFLLLLIRTEIILLTTWPTHLSHTSEYDTKEKLVVSQGVSKPHLSCPKPVLKFPGHKRGPAFTQASALRSQFIYITFSSSCPPFALPRITSHTLPTQHHSYMGFFLSEAPKSLTTSISGF